MAMVGGMGTNAVSGAKEKEMTQEEVSMIGKSMKKKKFRALIQEYVDEVSDPANRAEYDQYLNELEAKREMPAGMELLRPEPGICVITKLRFPSGQKQSLYLNICHHPGLGELETVAAESGEGQNVSLPFSMGPPRPDKCLPPDEDDTALTVDFCVSTITLARCVENSNILKVLVDIAADHMTQNFLKGKEEVLKDFAVSKDLACKGGTPYPMSVKAGTVKKDPTKKARDRKLMPQGDSVTPAELRQMKKDARKAMGKSEEYVPPAESEDEEEEEEPEEEITRIRVPKHKLLHVGSIDLQNFLEGTNGIKLPLHREIPKELKLVIQLPTVKGVVECDLDVSAQNVVLEVEDKFYLDLPLPFEIDCAKAKAKFDKHKTPAELQITMPVVPKVQDKMDPSVPWEDPSSMDHFVDEHDRLDTIDQEDELPELVDEPEAPSSPVEAEVPVPEEPAQPAEPMKPVDLRPRERLDDPSEPAGQTMQSEIPGFAASSTWSGARPGCVFKTGPHGTGYYKDEPFAPSSRVDEAPLLQRTEHVIAREVKILKVQEPLPEDVEPAIDMGEPTLVTEGETAARLWAVLSAEGCVEEATVRVAVRIGQVRVSWTAELDGQRYSYEWRRIVKHDIDPRQVHWEFTGRGQREILVLLRKDGLGVWGEEKFVEIAVGAAADEDWPVEEAEADAAVADTVVTTTDVNAREDVPAQEPEVPEALAGDALLGQAIPLETRLFLEIF